MQEEWLSLKETCNRFFISISTLNRWREEGLPFSSGTKGSRVLINTLLMTEFLKSRVKIKKKTPKAKKNNKKK